MQRLPTLQQNARFFVMRFLVILCLQCTIVTASFVDGIDRISAAPQQQDTPAATLRIAMPAPTSLDPVRISRFDPHTRDLVENLFIGLTRFDPVSQQIEPLLAESWSVSDDGLTWTIELREDMQWVRVDPDTGAISAVRPVAAGDVVYTIQRACNPLRPSPVTTNLMIIQGCHTVANAFPEVLTDLFIAREIGARATGPHTLEIDLLFPASYFPALLSTPELRPLPREAVNAAADWTSANNIITNGPYALREWTSTGLTLERNPYWPDPLAGNIESIAVTFTGNGITAATLVSAERADLGRLEPDEITTTRTAYPDLFQVVEGSLLTMLVFAPERAPVNITEMRQALAFATDRGELAASLPGSLPYAQFTPPTVVAAPQITTSAYDPGQAQTLLASAGFPGCNDVPERMTLLVPDDDPVWNEIGQQLVAQWTEVLGCNPALFELAAVSRARLIEFSHANYDPEQLTRPHLWIATWSPDYPDANAWLYDAFHCRYGYFRLDRDCGAPDIQFDQAAAETDVAARTALYADAESALVGPTGSFPAIPLVMSASAWLQQPWLTDVNTTGPARYDLWHIDTSAQVIP